jgi:hypothetical protein
MVYFEFISFIKEILYLMIKMNWSCNMLSGNNIKININIIVCIDFNKILDMMIMLSIRQGCMGWSPSWILSKINW